MALTAPPFPCITFIIRNEPRTSCSILGTRKNKKQKTPAQQGHIPGDDSSGEERRGHITELRWCLELRLFNNHILPALGSLRQVDCCEFKLHREKKNNKKQNPKNPNKTKTIDRDRWVFA